MCMDDAQNICLLLDVTGQHFFLSKKIEYTQHFLPVWGSHFFMRQALSHCLLLLLWYDMSLICLPQPQLKWMEFQWLYSLHWKLTFEKKISLCDLSKNSVNIFHWNYFVLKKWIPLQWSSTCLTHVAIHCSQTFKICVKRELRNSIRNCLKCKELL